MHEYFPSITLNQITITEKRLLRLLSTFNVSTLEEATNFGEMYYSLLFKNLQLAQVICASHNFSTTSNMCFQAELLMKCLCCVQLTPLSYSQIPKILKQVQKEPWLDECIPAFVATSIHLSRRRVLLVSPEGGAWYLAERVTKQSLQHDTFFRPMPPP